MTATDSDTRARVREIIRNQLSVEVPDVHTDLLAEGLLDSLALVMLIAAVEESFACELPLDDFDVENFRTVARIADFLAEVGVAPAHEPL
jgi:D-alanine--poly(phosphoribitol) ligase subunit 2